VIDRSPKPGLDSCLGVHVLEWRINSAVVRWYPVSSPGGRIRVVDYTCDCQPTFYEFCQVGGLFCIRRTRRIGSDTLVDETAPTRYATAIDIWTKGVLR